MIIHNYEQRVYSADLGPYSPRQSVACSSVLAACPVLLGCEKSSQQSALVQEDMYDQAPAVYCPAQFEFIKQKPTTAECQLTPEGTASDILMSGDTREQPGSHPADSQTKPIRLPDAPLAIRKMPSSGPAKAAIAIPTSYGSSTLAATFEEQPALPLRPTPSSGPAWKRIARPAPVLAKKDNPSLLSRLSRLTSSNGTPIPSRHVAGVVPPQSSPPLSLSAAPSQQAVQASQQSQRGQSSVRTYPEPYAEPQHSPMSSRQLPLESPLAQAHDAAPQPTPPAHPTEPEVKPKSTLRSRLRLQRPAAVTPPPDPPDPPLRPAKPIGAAQEQASQPSALPAAAELDHMLLVAQSPRQPVGRAPELAYPLEPDTAAGTPSVSGGMQSHLNEASHAGDDFLQV